jgi:AcrR family transcriptional regulator
VSARRSRSAPPGAYAPRGAHTRSRPLARVGVGPTGLASGGVPPRGQVAEIQRSRLLAGAVSEIDERGYSGTTVAGITGRARVSRRTFYELFAGREECLGAILEEVASLIEQELGAVSLAGCSWRERVRMGLWVILSFFDREPVLARVCVVQALRGGPMVLECRERVLARLTAVVDEGHGEGARAAGCTALTGEGVVGAVFTIVYARLQRREAEPLTGLLGELVGMIVLPYLGAGAARKELERPVPAALLPDASHESRRDVYWSTGDLLEGVPMRLTYRTARVLEGVGAHPGVSNRQVAESAGIGDQGQVSKLLRRLQRLGLLTNQGEGAHAKGEPNAWMLTPRGEHLTQSIRMLTPTTHEQRAA